MHNRISALSAGRGGRVGYSARHMDRSSDRKGRLHVSSASSCSAWRAAPSHRSGLIRGVSSPLRLAVPSTPKSSPRPSSPTARRVPVYKAHWTIATRWQCAANRKAPSTRRAPSNSTVCISHQAALTKSTIGISPPTAQLTERHHQLHPPLLRKVRGSPLARQRVIGAAASEASCPSKPSRNAARRTTTIQSDREAPRQVVSARRSSGMSTSRPQPHRPVAAYTQSWAVAQPSRVSATHPRRPQQHLPHSAPDTTSRRRLARTA